MRILSYDELNPRKGIPYSRGHLWRLEREGRFPKRVPLGGARHGWLDSEIDEWLAERVAQRDKAAARKIADREPAQLSPTTA